MTIDFTSPSRQELEEAYRVIAMLSGHLTDEGTDWTPEGLHKMRTWVADTLPVDVCPDWLTPYRRAVLPKEADAPRDCDECDVSFSCWKAGPCIRGMSGLSTTSKEAETVGERTWDGVERRERTPSTVRNYFHYPQGMQRDRRKPPAQPEPTGEAG